MKFSLAYGRVGRTQLEGLARPHDPQNHYPVDPAIQYTFCTIAVRTYTYRVIALGGYIKRDSACNRIEADPGRMQHLTTWLMDVTDSRTTF